MQVEEDWCANQVLGEVPEERDCPNAQRNKKNHLKSILLSSDGLMI